MDLIQKIKEQGNQASVMLPGVADMAASSEVVTVDITGCTSYDEDTGTYNIPDRGDDSPGHIKKAQILDWVNGKAKFLCLTFKYDNKYGSVLFMKDAKTDINVTDYPKDRFFIESFISRVKSQYFILDLQIWPSAGNVQFVVKTI